MLFRRVTSLSAVAVLGIMLPVGGFLALRATSALQVAGLGFLTETRWEPDAHHFGIAGVLTGTVLIGLVAVSPEVLLMDEPCSALDPTSTNRIEETIRELREEVTIVIVTHNMQQAQRVSDQCAFFLASAGQPGHVVEAGDTDQVFNAPRDPRTSDYVNGRFG